MRQSHERSVKDAVGGAGGYLLNVANMPRYPGEPMDNKTPKLNLTKTATKDLKVRTNVKAGEGTGVNSIVKIKWTY